MATCRTVSKPACSKAAQPLSRLNLASITQVLWDTPAKSPRRRWPSARPPERQPQLRRTSAQRQLRFDARGFADRSMNGDFLEPPSLRLEACCASSMTICDAEIQFAEQGCHRSCHRPTPGGRIDHAMINQPGDGDGDRKIHAGPPPEDACVSSRRLMSVGKPPPDSTNNPNYGVKQRHRRRRNNTVGTSRQRINAKSSLIRSRPARARLRHHFNRPQRIVLSRTAERR